MSALPPAGWYDDPEAAGGLRYWDGSAWTAHRHGDDAGPAKDPEAVEAPAPAEDEAPVPAEDEAPVPAADDAPEPAAEAAPWTPPPVPAPVMTPPAAVTGEPAVWASPSTAPPVPMTAPQWTASGPASVQWQPAPPARVAGAAAASLICSLLWLFGVASLVAIPLGILGRRAVADSGGTLEGNGMATTGIVLGVLGVLLGVAIVLSL